MNVSLLAIDLAKSTFQVCGVNRQGQDDGQGTRNISGLLDQDQ